MESALLAIFVIVALCVAALAVQSIGVFIKERRMSLYYFLTAVLMAVAGWSFGLLGRQAGVAMVQERYARGLRSHFDTIEELSSLGRTSDVARICHRSLTDITLAIDDASLSNFWSVVVDGMQSLKVTKEELANKPLEATPPSGGASHR